MCVPQKLISQGRPRCRQNAPQAQACLASDIATDQRLRCALDCDLVLSIEAVSPWAVDPGAAPKHPPRFQSTERHHRTETRAGVGSLTTALPSGQKGSNQPPPSSACCRPWLCAWRARASQAPIFFCTAAVVSSPARHAARNAFCLWRKRATFASGRRRRLPR